MSEERGAVKAQDLRHVLDKLDDVMAEAARLRQEVMRQLEDQRALSQQELTPSRKRPRPTRRR